MKKWREDSGLTLSEMAKKLDISESYYSLIERGKRQEKMDLALAAKISAIFGVPLSRVYQEESALQNLLAKSDEDGKQVTKPCCESRP